MAHELDTSDHSNMVLFTQVASTGECKVLHVFASFSFHDEQIFEIFTVPSMEAARNSSHGEQPKG
jgi:hypothetical protein